MNIQFHPPQDQTDYADRVLSVLLQAALPRFRARPERSEHSEHAHEPHGGGVLP